MKRPPKIAEKLLEIILPHDLRDYLIGDFEDIFHQKVEEKGHSSAACWYWLQVIVNIPKFIFNQIYWGIQMLRNYLKIAVRNFIRHKGYSFINIFGLATGLAAFILISLFVQYEFNYESQHINLEKIHRVNLQYKRTNTTMAVSFTPAPLAPALKENIPDVEEAVRVASFGRILFEYGDSKNYEENVVFVDPTIFDVFTMTVINGEESNPLGEPNSAVITESIAEKYFGDENPVGKMMRMENEKGVMVKAVIRESKNTLINNDFYVSLSTMQDVLGERFFQNKISTVLESFVILNENSNTADVEKKMNNYMMETFYDGIEHNSEVMVEPLKDIYLYSEVDGDGDINNVWIFSLSGILILLIASINFMNLSTARSANRAREVGLRKVTGAGRSSLIYQFLSESLIYTFLSLLLAILIVALLMPSFKNLSGQEIFFTDIFTSGFITYMLLISIVVGVISGFYPAVFLSAFNAVDVLKGELNSGTKGGRFRKILVVLQFTISVTLIAGTFIIEDQLDYMQNKNLGLNKDEILVLPLRSDETRAAGMTLKNELLKSSDIISVAGSDLLPSNIGRYNMVTWEGAAEGETISIQQMGIDFDFAKTYDLEIIKGRDFSREFANDSQNALLINEEAVKQFGWSDKNPVGRKVIQTFGNQRFELDVIGVLKDFHFMSLRSRIQPLKLYCRDRAFYYTSIRFNPEKTDEVIAHMESTWQKLLPNYPFNYFFLDEIFARRYSTEKNIREILSYFSILTILISCLGLLGLASYLAQQKTKEIGVRKVLGANSGDIIMNLSKGFMKWVIVANIIAIPIIYYSMNLWLDDFAYKTDISLLSVLFSVILSIVIAFGTVGFQALKAANANPIDSIKYE